MISVRDLAQAVCPFGARQRYLAVLRLYLDDSGSQESGTVFVMGGLIADERQWKKFEDQWAPSLSEAQIPMFHATDFYTRQIEPFKSWTNETHIKFSKLFTAIVARHMAAGVSRGVDVAAHAELVSPASDVVFPPDWRTLNIQPDRVLPIMLCARTCLEWIVREWPDRPQHEPIAVIFDSGTYGLGATIEYCRFLQRNTRWAKSYASFTIAEKSKFLPLQGADLMAWLSYKQITKEIQSAGQPTHKALQRLAETKRISVSFGTKNGLSTFMKELRKFRETSDVP